MQWSYNQCMSFQIPGNLLKVLWFLCLRLVLFIWSHSILLLAMSSLTCLSGYSTQCRLEKYAIPVISIAMSYCLNKGIPYFNEVFSFTLRTQLRGRDYRDNFVTQAAPHCNLKKSIRNFALFYMSLLLRCCGAAVYRFLGNTNEVYKRWLLLWYLLSVGCSGVYCQRCSQ